MASPLSKSDLTPADILATLAIVTTFVSETLYSYEVLDDPIKRWIVWGVIALLFLFASILSRDGRAQFLKDSEQQSERNNTRRRWCFLGFVVLMAVLSTDVYAVWFFTPIRCSGMNEFEGGVSGITPNTPDNPLLVENVANILPVTSFPFGGATASTLFQKRDGVDQLLIHECNVTVEKFAEMPAFKMSTAGAHEIDAIEASFTLSRKGDSLPWVFHATNVRLNGRDANLPLLVDDLAPNMLKYFIGASDPGIYWVKCELVVSNSVGKARKLMLTDKAVPLAFFPDSGGPSEIDFDAISKSKEWVFVPVLSPEE
jgi:hypothetical protein